ncbi:hypothetical protein E2C01_055801 [Portunus trituberculatus]|uniref:Uncharacterized protein n=1 Tax=Portunus trituberculatus TaxID=210409 RepID=A0A5B7GWI1_PORTR|nr:hypothetical protein [Portunus trituberculatus]
MWEDEHHSLLKEARQRPVPLRHKHAPCVNPSDHSSPPPPPLPPVLQGGRPSPPYVLKSENPPAHSLLADSSTSGSVRAHHMSCSEVHALCLEILARYMELRKFCSLVFEKSATSIECDTVTLVMLNSALITPPMFLLKQFSCALFIFKQHLFWN